MPKRALQVLPDDVKSDERYIASMHDASWNEYDETIKRDVAFYNKKFSGTPGFVALDWRYVKAMLWTEVLAGPKGAPDEWNKFPMQIGRRAADAGFAVISQNLDNSDLVTTPELRQEVAEKGKQIGTVNVRAGIAYLYHRAMIINRGVPVIDDSTPRTYVMLPGESLDSIAGKLGTTKKVLLDMNNLDEEKAKKLRAGKELNYMKAHTEIQIGGWIDWMEAIRNYNTGDDKYILKVTKAYKIITSRTVK